MILEENSDHRRMHKFVIAIFLFETICCSGLNLTTPNRFENMCEQYNTVIHDDRSNNMTYKIKKFCTDYYFGLEVDNTTLLLCVSELKEKGCSIKKMCLSKILNDEKLLKSIYCIEHMYFKCVENFEFEFNVILYPSAQVEGSETLLGNILGVCTNLSGSSTFRRTSYLPFCSQLDIKALRGFYGNIDFSVWKSASTKLVCKSVKINYKFYLYVSLYIFFTHI